MNRESRDQTLYDAIAAKYMRKDLVPSSAMARKSQLFAAIKPVLQKRGNLGTIVDIGCGIGAPGVFLNGRYAHYIGLDQSAEMIEAGKQFNQDLENVTLIADNVKASSVPDNTADLILVVGALHHMTGLDDVMQSMVRMAKPGADFVIIEPQNGNPLIQFMRWIRTKIDATYSEEQIFFSEQELLDLLQRHGVKQLNIAYHGFLATPFAQVIINPQIISVPLSRFAIWIDSWLNHHLRGPLRKLSFNIVLTGTFNK